MKKLLLLSVLGATIATTAPAVQQCINLSATSACSVGANKSFTSSWQVVCGLNTVSGIALCGKVSDVDTTVTPGYSMTSAENQHCYCKMTYPATSTVWVRYNAASYVDTATCTQYCATNCAETFVDTKQRVKFLSF